MIRINDTQTRKAHSRTRICRDTLPIQISKVDRRLPQFEFYFEIRQDPDTWLLKHGALPETNNTNETDGSADAEAI